METQTIEFTVEQLLDLHRYWITELFIMDKKSEEEIVNLLHHHQINITSHTLHSYLSNWNLLTPRKRWWLLYHICNQLAISTWELQTIASPSYSQHRANYDYLKLCHHTQHSHYCTHIQKFLPHPYHPITASLGRFRHYSQVLNMRRILLAQSLRLRLKSCRFGKPTGTMEGDERNPEIPAWELYGFERNLYVLLRRGMGDWKKVFCFVLICDSFIYLIFLGLCKRGSR